MSATIYKYPISITDRQEIMMPGQPEVLSVGLDPGGQPCVWARVRPGEPDFKVHLRVYGTGNPCDVPPEWPFIGTFLQHSLVWHVFASRGVSR